LSTLESKVLNIKDSKISIVGGGICNKNVIEFITPIKISLDNLSPVDVYFLTVKTSKRRRHIL